MSIPASLLRGHGDGAEGAPNDTSEQVVISSMALIKMLRHGRAGVPMEVMGLMLGEFIDQYTIRVVDVFSMPQSGNTVSVEAVDPVYQAEMLDMLKRTGRTEMVVGWYHSHPGFGCWFSGTDINTQQSFEQLNNRVVGVVVDPVQSVRGSVVIDCFRLINPHMLLLGGGGAPGIIGGGSLDVCRQVTSNIGHTSKASIAALVHGLNKHYYSLVINYKKSLLEQKILCSVMQPKWIDALKIQPSDFTKNRFSTGLQENAVIRAEAEGFKKTKAELALEQASSKSFATIKDLLRLYKKEIEDDLNLSQDEILHTRVGKLNATKQLRNTINQLLQSTITHAFTVTLSSTVY